MMSRRIMLQTLRDPARITLYSRRLTTTTKTSPATITSSNPLETSPPASTSSAQPKPFVAPPPWKRRTPAWLLNSPVFVKFVKSTAWFLGHNSKTTTAIRETRVMYQQCAEREVKETGFIYVECRLAPTFQTWFSYTNLHMWLLTTRLRGLPAPYGRLYVQELINHFFNDAEYRLRAVYGPKCPERIIKRQMYDIRDQWMGSTASYDVAMMKGDTELAAAVWRNVFAARGEKAYKEKDLSPEEKEKLLEKRRKDNDPEAEGAPLEEIPKLVFMYVAHLRRELQRLEAVSDEEVIAGRIGKIGRVGVINHPDVDALEGLGTKAMRTGGGP